MKKFSLVLCFTLLVTLPLIAQASIPAATAPATESWSALSFLEGTWEAKTTDPEGPHTRGRYTFVRELDGHILARHDTNDPGCKAPASFDCQHGDLLYIFQNAPGQPLQAIYFDNEGHTLHYDITTPTRTSVIFLSQPGPGPQFRLVYELKGTVMTGKFQMRIPGGADWHSYLEWSGGKV